MSSFVWLILVVMVRMIFGGLGFSVAARVCGIPLLSLTILKGECLVSSIWSNIATICDGLEFGSSEARSAPVKTQAKNKLEWDSRGAKVDQSSRPLLRLLYELNLWLWGFASSTTWLEVCLAMSA